MRRHLKQRTDSARHTLALLAKADYVLTDNSGFIFDAIHVDKRVILLDFPGMNDLLDGEKKLFQRAPTSESAKYCRLLMMLQNCVICCQRRLTGGRWQAQLQEIRHHYCDAFMDGKAGERAAIVIVEALG